MLKSNMDVQGLNGCCHGLIRPTALGNADLVTRGPLENSHQQSIAYADTALFKNNSTFRTLKNQDMVKKCDPVSD